MKSKLSFKFSLLYTLPLFHSIFFSCVVESFIVNNLFAERPPLRDRSHFFVWTQGVLLLSARVPTEVVV